MTSRETKSVAIYSRFESTILSKKHAQLLSTSIEYKKINNTPLWILIYQDSRVRSELSTDPAMVDLGCFLLDMDDLDLYSLDLDDLASLSSPIFFKL